MTTFQKYNNIIGWLIFALAATVYILTLEPTASYWDCGEFIAVSYKLEVPHPPGAPMFLLIGRMFSMLAGSDTSQVAYWVNMSSALASAFCIMFLFWSIVMLARKVMKTEDGQESTGDTIAILGAGAIGALAYTFSDSFWFSAVEAEVYAMSSFFTAVVFWAVLKWERITDTTLANRWLILIAYIIGLSIGIHLLNLVVLPALGMIMFFKFELHKKPLIIKGSGKFNPTRYFIGLGIVYIIFAIGSGNGSLGAGFGKAIMVPLLGGLAGLVLYFINTSQSKQLKLPNNPWLNFVIVSLISLVAIFFVLNGVIIGIPSLAGSYEIYFVNSLGLGFGTGAGVFGFLLIAALVYGLWYSVKHDKVILNTVLLCLTMILIGYSSYSLVLIRSNFNTPIDENNPEDVMTFISYLKREQYGEVPSLLYGNYFDAQPIAVENGDPIWAKGSDKYELVSYKQVPKYDDKDMTLFPRAWSREQRYTRMYRYWMDLGPNQKPSFKHNMRYFFQYQLGFSYFRYFGWNFVGRESNIQNAGVLGPFEDSSKVPTRLKNNKARNNLYALPLLLGLAGLLFHLFRDPKNAGVVGMLFILTGIALIVYLNIPSTQPRERDYIYVGSFYAFAIWIGFGVLAIYDALKKPIKATAIAAAIATVVSAAVPGIMLAEEWDDHDRSNRYFSVDSAINLLESCAPNAILFTGGDNDTFPLWYAQEVEGIRTDVRVVVQSYFNTDWYIDQMTRQAYESAPFPFSLTYKDYGPTGRNTYLRYEQTQYPTMNAEGFLQLIKTNHRVVSGRGQYNILPSQTLFLEVDTDAVLAKGIVPDELKSNVVGKMFFKAKRGAILIGDLMTLDIIVNAKWDRPVYFNTTSLNGSAFEFSEYVVQEGNAYRLLPVKNPQGAGQNYMVNTEVMYDNLMNKFQFRGLQDPDVYYSTEYNNFVLNTRASFNRLAQVLIQQGKREQAKEVLMRSVEVMPHTTIPYDIFSSGTLSLLASLADDEAVKAQAKDMADILAKQAVEMIEYQRRPSVFDRYEIDRQVAILSQSINALKRIGENDLANDYNAKLKQFRN